MSRIAYLGPAGTFNEDALRLATRDGDPVTPLRASTVREAILAVESGEAERALVPFENSTEGSVRATLDTLALEATGVEIVGEFDYPVRASLIARRPLALARIAAVLSHPQALAQSARFLRERLPQAEARAAPSTAEAVREVSASHEPLAALGARSAAELYGCEVLVEDVSDEADNVTRFVWVAPAGTIPRGEGPWKTSLVFSELGEDHPGALVEALVEFSGREINLTRIESRPLRRGLGRYMFFCDLEGSASSAPVAEAIEGLRGKAESVRILGSYPVSGGAGT
ncbi:MAG: prephenate dehydratase [Solirubrobacterales bacterium]